MVLDDESVTKVSFPLFSRDEKYNLELRKRFDRSGFGSFVERAAGFPTTGFGLPEVFGRRVSKGSGMEAAELL